MPQDDIIEQLVKDVEELKRENKRLQNLTPLYTVLNENTPAAIGADQNNYDPGNYDLLRVTTSGGARNITGISGGIKGRQLTFVLLLGSAGNLNFLHENASSSAANRITCPGSATFAMNNFNCSVTLEYDGVSARWRFIGEAGRV